MSQQIIVGKRQYDVLRVVAELNQADVNTLASKIGVQPEDIMRDLAELANRGLLEVSTEQKTVHELTEHGKRYLERGLPEEVSLRVFRQCLNTNVREFLECLANRAGLSKEDANVAFQILVREGCLKVDRDGLAKLNDEVKCLGLREESAYLRYILLTVENGLEPPQTLVEVLKKRRMISTKKRSVVLVKAKGDLKELISRDIVVPKQLLTVVLPSHYAQLEEAVVKKFDLSIPPPGLRPSLSHPFMEFIKQLREVLVAMGFEEVRGPHVEAEFWNFDVLFQPQDHPAREIHDTFFVVNKAVVDVPSEAFERVRRIHEAGWKYSWDQSRALRLVLRTQCTAVSARTIYSRGGGEYRAFTIDRVFRPENLDAKHSMEFYQLDGIIVGRNVNFKHLLYFFKEFASALGIREVWFKPGYFPFTEPSVEGYIKHPTLGWVEVFPGGIFRPEVMEILGAKEYRAAAWGIGVDRLAMWFMGVDDIRQLFARDLDLLRDMGRRPLPFFIGRASGRDVIVRSRPE